MSKTDDYTNVPYKKRKKQTSKSSRRSNHKHQYEKIIMQAFVGWCWGKRCTVCGRIEEKFIFSCDNEFLKPEYKNSSVIGSYMFLSVEELKEKYEGIPIYKMREQIPDGLWNYELIEN